jgi:thaumarchaeosortase
MVTPLAYLGFSSRKMKDIGRMLIRILPLIAFVPPFLILYSLYPGSFEQTWKGRTFYIFFLWLVALELIMNWDKVPKFKISKVRSVGTVAFISALLLPTIYIIAANYLGINNAIENWATTYHVDPNLIGDVPLSIEYLVFTVLFALIVYLGFGIRHLKDSALSTLFLASIGIIYTIDNFYPNGTFTPFQILVPTTTQLAAGIFNLMGYSTRITQSHDSTYGWLTQLYVRNPRNPVNQPFNPQTLAIAWPCAGVESLIIYTVTILIFLKGSNISWIRRTIYFAVGAIVTYFINILRIVTLFTIALSYGSFPASPQFTQFHNYYGPLYSVTWIMFYPLMIIGSQFLWNRVKAGINEEVVRDTSELPLPTA